MHAIQYYVRFRGKSQGPFTLEDLQRMRQQGALTRFHKILGGPTGDDGVPATELESLLAPAVGEAVATIPPQVTDPRRIPTAILDTVVVPFPVGVLLFLHYTTLGMFSFFYITGLHGQLPRVVSTDLNARKAVGLCFVPVFNIAWWFFVVYPDLCRRLSDLRGALGLRGRLSEWWGYSLAVLIALSTALVGMWGTVVLLTGGDWERGLYVLLAPGVVLAGVILLVYWPWYAATVQRHCNEIGTQQIRCLQAAVSLCRK